MIIIIVIIVSKLIKMQGQVTADFNNVFYNRRRRRRNFHLVPARIEHTRPTHPGHVRSHRRFMSKHVGACCRFTVSKDDALDICFYCAIPDDLHS